MSLDMQSAWTRYWNTGRTESCPEDRAAGHLVVLESAWREFFSGFPPRAKLLDLATGGGEVIRIAFGLGRDFDITGVDLADLSAVSRTLQDTRVKLVGSTDLSKLPFPDGSFDGVTSQFGIEYADIPAATREAVRVLSPNGRGRFLLHHYDSPITRAGDEKLRAYDCVFSDSRAFEFGKTVFALYQHSAPQADIAQAEAHFRTAVGILHRRLRPNDSSLSTARKVVDFLSDLASAPMKPEPADALRRMEIKEDEMQAWRQRQRAQSDAALDRRGMHQLIGYLAGAGAIVESSHELKHANGQVLAWICSFHK